MVDLGVGFTILVDLLRGASPREAAVGAGTMGGYDSLLQVAPHHPNMPSQPRHAPVRVPPCRSRPATSARAFFLDVNLCEEEER